MFECRRLLLKHNNFPRMVSGQDMGRLQSLVRSFETTYSPTNQLLDLDKIFTAHRDFFSKLGCEKHGVHSSETNYFVYGTSVSLCSKHLGHNSCAHFSGQLI